MRELLHTILNVLLQELVTPLEHIFPGKLTIYCRVLKSVACLAPARKAAGEMRITTFSNPLE
jgi:hypothetical protein